MTIEIINETPNQTKIIIKGNVKSISDSQQVKETVDNVSKSSNNITIELIDSFALTSSTIGFFTKKVRADNINLNLIVHSEQLYELLEMLALIDMFNVRRV